MFEDLIEEEMAFSNASYMDVTDLRALYYNRRDLFVSFTDQGDYYIDPQYNELDRPNSIVCYRVEDVVGRKVATSYFYANVFRLKLSNSLQWIDNIRKYSWRALDLDVLSLELLGYTDPTNVKRVADNVMKMTTIRSPFEKLWTITEYIAKDAGGDDYASLWRKLLLDLGYGAITDPTKTGILTGEKKPVTIYLDFGAREDLDILNIQRYRQDHRQRVKQHIDLKLKRMANSRNRIAKVNPDQYKNSKKGVDFEKIITKATEYL